MNHCPHFYGIKYNKHSSEVRYKKRQGLISIQYRTKNCSQENETRKKSSIHVLIGNKK